MLPEEAWNKLVRGSEDRDLDDIRDAINAYIKPLPEVTYVDLEKAFRDQQVNVHLIAVKKEDLAKTYTLMDLQGKLGCTYAVTYRLSDKPKRPKENEGWPKSPEENIERLKDAGEAVDCGVPLCGNCNNLGHIAKHCKEDKDESNDRIVVKCYNCDETGHRVRDCKFSISFSTAFKMT
jgi:hypothetical protein